jgi:hypothetical protein
MNPMPLNYLAFEASDDGDGLGTWEALASVRPADQARLWAEAQAFLAQAEALAPGPRGPLDEGGVWDVDQHSTDDGGWVTLTLTLTGPWEWGEALLARFD